MKEKLDSEQKFQPLQCGGQVKSDRVLFVRLVTREAVTAVLGNPQFELERRDVFAIIAGAELCFDQLEHWEKERAAEARARNEP